MFLFVILCGAIADDNNVLFLILKTFLIHLLIRFFLMHMLHRGILDAAICPASVVVNDDLKNLQIRYSSP